MTYARVAGFTFIFYIAAGITSLTLGGQSQFADLLYFLQNVSALVLGMIASVLLVLILPLQLAGILTSSGWTPSVTWMIWLPMLVFEVTLALWLLIKGVAAPQISTMAHASH